MKVLVFVKATANSEQGIFPPDSERLFREMGEFNEKLVKAGVMKEGDGLKPSSAGKRVHFTDGGQTTVIDGPFAETKELVAGYWVWEVKSVDEAVEWAKQCPNPMPGEEGTLEIRPCYSMEEFTDIASPEEFEREARMRKEIARQESARAKSKPSGAARKVKAAAKSRTAKPKPAKRGPARRKPARARSKK
jgi:hypothetical protein